MGVRVRPEYAVFWKYAGQSRYSEDFPLPECDSPETFRWVIPADAPLPKTDDLARLSLHITADIDAKLKKLLSEGRTCVFTRLRIHFHTDLPQTQGQGEEILPTPAELSEAVSRIESLAGSALEPLRLRITGHTDQRQSHDYNQALSNRRAQWLLKHLRERLRNFPFEEAEIIGIGEALASGPKDNPADRYCEITIEPLMSHQ